jgi:hypothetical protein
MVKSEQLPEGHGLWRGKSVRSHNIRGALGVIIPVSSDSTGIQLI